VLFGKPSRRLWVVAIVASLLCVGGLAVALVSDWDAEPDRQQSSRTTPTGRQVAGSRGGGFTLGLVVGIGAGVVLGSLIALRAKPVAKDQRDVS